MRLSSHDASRPAALRRLASLFALALAPMLLVACNDPNDIDLPDGEAMQDGGTPPDARGSFSDSSIGRTDLSLARVVPDHGPFTGGNTVILRGSGFTDDSQVRFGGRDVQPADHELIDARRLAVVVPAGEVGVTDVEITVDGETVVLADGYTYDSIFVDPSSGSVAGGTFVTITGSGTFFRDGDTVTFGRTRCTDVTVVSENRITCRTPPSSAGRVDVTVTSSVDASETSAPDSFEYYDSSDPIAGGLGGGPIAGTINITAIDAMTGMPVPDAFAMVGSDTSTAYQGLTDVMGQITFSGTDLVAPATVHIAKHCYERTSVVAFDATDVTVFLVPWMDPMCGMGMGMPPTGRGRNGAFIEGHLQWPADMRRMEWDNVPEARAGWTRVAYVYTTQIDVNIPNPDPGAGGGTARVLEVPADDDGFPFRIFARPAGLAVYALAGLEEESTGRFVPYVMGVARNVLAGPGQTVRDVNVVMDIPLDHYVDVQLGALPPEARTGPDRFRVQAFIDLGGEGIINRVVNGTDFDTIRRRDGSTPFRFVGQPALYSSLRDARYRLRAGWYTGDFDGQPYSVVVENGVTAVDETVTLPDFLGIPQAVSPAYGDRIPDDRVLRWESRGTEDPDFHIILMVGGGGNAEWRMFVRGDTYEAPIPDLSMIDGLEDIQPGFITWVVYAVNVPGLSFDEFRYTYLNDRYWSHSALDYFLAQL